MLFNNITPARAIALQKEWREKINLSPLQQPVTTIAGADISFNKYEDTVYAGIVVLRYADLSVIDKVAVVTRTSFPYIPGLLAFRELPAITEAWDQLNQKPDVLVFDGHGIAHMRRTGIATSFGILHNTVTIGCGKTRLVGHFNEPDNTRFACSPLLHQQEQVGVVLRTKVNCKPVFISPGHKINMEQSVAIMKHCTGTYRIPTPTRLAHEWVNEVRKRGKNM